MIPKPSIVVVDDDKKDLSSLCNCLRSEGYMALPVPYEEGKPQLPAPLSTIQILFMDIHLVSGVPAGQPTYSVVASALEKIIAPDCGPYILITWSTHATEHDNLMEYLVSSNIPAPAASACLDKEKYLDANGDDAGNLFNGVKEAIERVPEVDALIGWHDAARIASGEVVNSLLRFVGREICFAGKSGPELGKLMAAIARQGAGKNASDDLTAAMNSGLEPILVDRVLNATKDHRDFMEARWKAALPDVARQPDLDDDQIANLNTITSISNHDIENAKAGDRGIVSTLPFEKEEDFACAFGGKPEEVIKQFISMKNRELRADQQLSKNQKQELWQDIVRQCSFCLVGISAACDHSWGKTPVRKLMLAVKFSQNFCGNFESENHGAIYKTPCFDFPEVPGRGVLVFNWRYYWTTAEKNIGGENLYRLREPLISHLITNYHVHGFRPGMPEYKRAKTQT